MAKRKLDAKAFSRQKRKRRQWITFLRMCRYGVNNFSRNAWLTIAATAVMTITLLIMFITFSARTVLQDTVTATRDKVEMSVYLITETPEEEAEHMMVGLRKLPTVSNVRYVSPEAGQKEFAQNNTGDQATLDALNEATNKFPGTLRIKLVDINDTRELQEYVDKNGLIQSFMHPDREPSYEGPLKESIKTIAQATDFAQRFGSVVSVIFVAISSLIVFNTIRMAIFNRKDEIQMMKLIGADRNFIRGPFVVEAVVYGFIAAVLATGLGLGILYAVKPYLAEAGVAIDNAVSSMTMYVGVVVLVMIAIGSVIGVISSLLATRRYLKI